MAIDEEATGMNTDSQAQAWLLFTDDAGQAYLLPHELLEQARLSAEQLAALRAQLDDVRGNTQDISERPAPLQLGLQAVITNRQVLAGLRGVLTLPGLQGFLP
ncbi:MAG: hypothetical protein ACRDJ9_14555, partial [Dehalococcoidia bacterium]